MLVYFFLMLSIQKSHKKMFLKDVISCSRHICPEVLLNQFSSTLLVRTMKFLVKKGKRLTETYLSWDKIVSIRHDFTFIREHSLQFYICYTNFYWYYFNPIIIFVNPFCCKPGPTTDDSKLLVLIRCLERCFCEIV